jgi:ATP-binding cassette, subfamily B, bacterial HlyB/CyaB
MVRLHVIGFSWFLHSFRGSQPALVETAALSIVLRLLALVSPFAMQTLIDRVLPYERRESLFLIFALLIVVAIFEGLLGYLAERLSTWISSAVSLDLGLRAIGHTFRLPLQSLGRWPVGELLARLGETQAIQAFLSYATVGLALDAAFALFYACVLWMISPQLTGILLASIPIQLILFFVFGPWQRKRFDRAFLQSAAHSGRCVEALGRLTTIKALAAEERILGRLKKTALSSAETALSATNLVALSGNLSSALDKVLISAVIFFGAERVLSGDLSLGQLIAFHLLSSHVSGPILGLARLWDDWQNVQVARRRGGHDHTAWPADAHSARRAR